MRLLGHKKDIREFVDEVLQAINRNQRLETVEVVKAQCGDLTVLSLHFKPQMAHSVSESSYEFGQGVHRGVVTSSGIAPTLDHAVRQAPVAETALRIAGNLCAQQLFRQSDEAK